MILLTRACSTSSPRILDVVFDATGTRKMTDLTRSNNSTLLCSTTKGQRHADTAAVRVSGRRDNTARIVQYNRVNGKHDELFWKEEGTDGVDGVGNLFGATEESANDHCQIARID
jgi:hypothetical protein